MKILETNHLSIGYPRKKSPNLVQSDLNLEMIQGELVCLIGPNGSGKSTLLRTLSGLQLPISGKVKIEGKNIEKLKYDERATLISLVLTDKVEIEHATVHSIVAMGRYPYSGWWGELSDEDEALIQRTINMLHLESKVHSLFSELSDGEKQKTLIAKAFVQDTPIIILDEPTAHLDLPTRIEIMLLLHKLAHNTHTAVLLSTHELDMALQAADKIWLMTKEGGLTTGVPEDLVFNGAFDAAFQNNNYVFNPANGNFSMNYPMYNQIAVVGNKLRMYWTLRALARAGFEVVLDADTVVEVKDNNWKIRDTEFSSVEDLLKFLKANF